MTIFFQNIHSWLSGARKSVKKAKEEEREGEGKRMMVKIQPAEQFCRYAYKKTA